jgi:integrase
MRKTEKKGRKILPGIWQLNRTTFIVRAQPKDPHTGKKRNVRRVLLDSTRHDAIAVREGLLASVHLKPTISTNRETVAAFVEFWLKHKKARGDVTDSTHERYALALGHVSKRILDAQLGDVTPEMIERWIASAITPKGERKPYEASTVNSWLRVLRTVFNDACRLRGLATNPATLVKALNEPVDLEESNALPPAALGRVLDELFNDDRCVAMMALTQAFTGLRFGEVSALHWTDLDEADRVLTIRRTNVKGKLVPATKTKRSRRVGVPPFLLVQLRAHRDRLTEENHAGHDSGLMFPSSVGRLWWTARLSEALRAACERAGIKQRFTSHGFRRSMTDLLREAAVDPVVAKEITGHSTDRMREHYSTVRAADIRAAGDAAAALVTPKLKLILGGAAQKESSEESSAADGSETAGEVCTSNRP